MSSAPSSEAGPSNPKPRNKIVLAEQVEEHPPVRSSSLGSSGRQLGGGWAGADGGEDEEEEDSDTENESEEEEEKKTGAEGADTQDNEQRVESRIQSDADDSDSDSDTDEEEDQGAMSTEHLAAPVGAEGYQVETTGNEKKEAEQEQGQRTLADTGIAPTVEAVKGELPSGGEEDDEEDEEDEEEEEEPSLKYQRLGPGSTEILVKDTASALAASSRFVVSIVPFNGFADRGNL